MRQSSLRLCHARVNTPTVRVFSEGDTMEGMSDQPSSTDPATNPSQAPTVIGPDGQPVTSLVAMPTQGEDGAGDGQAITDLVSQPAKVMRIGSMIKQLLDEVKSAPLDEAARARLRDIHARSLSELEDGLAPELVDELQRLSLPLTDDVAPSEAELRIAQAQLVGWLEGLFHGIQTALFAQQMAARAQFEEMRRRAGAPQGMLPPGVALAPGEDGGADTSTDRSSHGPYL